MECESGGKENQRRKGLKDQGRRMWGKYGLQGEDQLKLHINFFKAIKLYYLIN